MQRSKTKRAVRLVQPGLQLRLILTFAGVAALALLLQFTLFMSALSEAAVELPNDGLVLLERTHGILTGVFVTSLALLLPTLFGIGLVLTHRVAGPIYRMEAFLNQLARGESPPDLRLRRGDELQEFGQLVNRATEPLRRPGPGRELPTEDGSESTSEEPARAA